MCCFTALYSSTEHIKYVKWNKNMIQLRPIIASLYKAPRSWWVIIQLLHTKGQRGYYSGFTFAKTIASLKPTIYYACEMSIILPPFFLIKTLHRPLVQSGAITFDLLAADPMHKMSRQLGSSWLLRASLFYTSLLYAWNMHRKLLRLFGHFSICFNALSGKSSPSRSFYCNHDSTSIGARTVIIKRYLILGELSNNLWHWSGGMRWSCLLFLLLGGSRLNFVSYQCAVTFEV